jgi:ABC-type molybdate transport system substrate-binding protein
MKPLRHRFLQRPVVDGMAKRGKRFTFGVAVFAFAIVPTSAIAAEMKALVTIGVQSAIEELTPQFEKVTGHKISAAFDLSTALSRRIQDGETRTYLSARATKLMA